MKDPKLEEGDNDNLFQEVSDLFDKAERCMKPFEHAAGLYIPTVNQLRYAGWHVKNYLVTNKKEELQKAKRHCQRAIYDAHDAQMQYYLQEIEALEKDFPNIPIPDTFPEFYEMVNAKNEALEFLGNSTDNVDHIEMIETPTAEQAAVNDNQTREQFYLECEPHTRELRKWCAKLPVARNELNKKVNDITTLKKEKRTMLIISVLSLLIGLIGAISSFFL